MARDPDKIHIRDLRVQTIIGVYTNERIKPKELIINVTLYFDATTAAVSDKIKDTVSYDVVANRITALAEGVQHHLIETLANDIAQTLLKEFAVQQVKICVDKPGILPSCRSVGVEIIRP